MSILVEDENGNLKYVDEGEGFSGAKPALSRKQAKAAGTPRKALADLERGKNFINDIPVIGKANKVLQDLRSGFTFGLDKRASALGTSLAEAATGQGFNYSRNLEREKQEEAQRAGETGLAGTTARFVGGMAVPIGGAGTAIKLAEKVRGGKELGRFGTYLVGGAGAGATGGALGGAAEADWSDPEDIARRTATGAGGGALLGSALGGGGALVAPQARRIVQSVGGRRARRAMARDIVESAQTRALETVERGGSLKAAERELADAEARNAEPMLADVNIAARGEAKRLQNRGLRGADEAAQTAVTRSNRRGGRLRNAIAEISGIAPQTLAQRSGRTVRKARLDEGEEGYASAGFLDNAAPESRVIDEILNKSDASNTEAHAIVRKAFKDANDAIDINRELPNPFVMVPREGAPGGEVAWPTMRAVDLVIRDLRGKADTLYKSDTALAEGINSVRKALQKELRQNGEYADLLDQQAAGLAKESAIKFAQANGSKVLSNPREVLDDLMTKYADKPEELQAIRSALVSEMFDKTRSRTLPKQVLDSIDDPNQPEAKALWDFIMDGPENTNKLRNWIKGELPATAVDRYLAGNVSATGELTQGGADSAGQIAGAVGRAAIGQATGNTAMMAGNVTNAVTRAMDAVRKGPGAMAEDALLLRILTRKARSGDLTKMERRALRRAKRQKAERERLLNRTGRVIGMGIGGIQPGEGKEDF